MINKLRQLMKENNISYYVIPTDDDHQSENVGEYFQARKEFSGFTGSAGTLLVTVDNAYLWTDGRYFIQANKELKDGIQLMKMNTEGYPSLLEFLASHIKENEVLGFDGKTMTASFISQLKEKVKFELNIECIDLITPIWMNRPSMSCEKAFLYDTKYHGKETKDKLNEIRKCMKEDNADSHLVATLDDIAWIFNIRGNDIESTPVVLAYALITLDHAYLYLQDNAYDESIRDYLNTQGVEVKGYYDIYEDIKEMNGSILVDLNNINYELSSLIKCNIINKANPSQYKKAIKNDVEIKNTINAHLKDGVAVTKFMYWLKKNVGKIDMDEVSVSDYLTSLRAEQELFIEPSFTTISAYNENAALMHYHAHKDHCASLKDQGFLLVDSGGQYYDGTTDITRTFVLGPISDIQKKHFTLVLKGMLNLQKIKFLNNQTGIDLDVLARAPMWNEGIDYQCGTGHGVGHLLCVHEGPNEFRPKSRVGEPVVLKEGMITTDEPGIYLEGQYGIRLENELLCQKDIKNEYGQYMSFKCLTLVPLDLDGIDVTMLSYDEKEALNNYHQEVYDKISPYLTNEEREWLKKYTRNI
jgi:Xaa-Pro aminopeptidase